MKGVLVFSFLLVSFMSAQFAEAKTVKCSYVSKVDGPVDVRTLSDEIVIDMDALPANHKSDMSPVAIREVVGGTLKIFASQNVNDGIAMKLDLGKEGAVVASSEKSDGTVHLDMHKSGAFGAESFTSAKCEFAN
jgi:hypothetical protein